LSINGLYQEHRIQNPDRPAGRLSFQLGQDAAIEARLSGRQDDHIDWSMLNHVTFPPS
jgi:hypothetical protein